MNYKYQLRELSIIVNDGLNIYIKVHNEIHRESETFWSSVKNTYGMGVPMADLLKYSESLVPQWDLINLKMNEFKVDSYNNLTSNEKHYFDLLFSYVAALRNTVDLLVERQKFMDNGTNMFLPWILSWMLFQKKRKAYQSSIENYCILGQKLNDSKYIVFN
jgi:hypothetical protein